MPDDDFVNQMNKFADDPVVREFTGPNMGKYILIALKGKVAGILSNNGFNSKETIEIISKLHEENNELMRKLVAKEIELSVFLWKVVWFSNTKKFESLRNQIEKE